MNKLVRGIGRMLLGLLVLFLVAWVIAASLRWRAVDDGDRAAIALMDALPPEPEGSNGYAALMLADFEVPEAEREAALLADVARFRAWQDEAAAVGSFWSASDSDDGLMQAYEPFAGATWARRPPLPGGEAPLCTLRDGGCLARVQAAPDAVLALLQQHAPRLADIDAALAADHLYSPYPESISTPLPPLAAMRLPLTAAAYAAVDGRVSEAYSRSCSLLASARRIDRESRSLIEKFVAQALGEGAALLLLDLRRAHPVATLPDDCQPALAPVDVDEALICGGLRGEFRMHRALDRQLNRRLQGWRPENVAARALLYDSTLQSAWVASAFAPFCSEEARTLAATGSAPPAPPVPVSSADAECYGAFVSCTLIQIASPSFDDYAGRALDHAAILRLLLAAQAVADGRSEAQAAALAAGNAGYPVTFDAEKQTATITLRAPRGGDGRTFVVDFAGLAPAPPVDSFADDDARGGQSSPTRV